MVAKETLKSIAQYAHQFAKRSFYCNYSYRNALKDGFKKAWAHYYTKTKEIVVTTLEEVYSATTEYLLSANDLDDRAQVRVFRDLRAKGLNCKLILTKDGYNRKLAITFAGTGLLKEFAKRFNLQATTIYRAEAVRHYINKVNKNVERNIFIDELLADLA